MRTPPTPEIVSLNTIALWGKASIDMFTISGDFGATLGVPKAEEDDEDDVAAEPTVTNWNRLWLWQKLRLISLTN